MEKKYVLSKRNAISIIAFVMSFSIALGILAGRGIALGPKTEKDSMNEAYIIQQFIEDQIDKNVDLKAIEKEAKKLGKKQGLIVSFVSGESYNSTKVNIMLNLGNKSPTISSFEVAGGK